MRFALIAISTAALAVNAGCGGSGLPAEVAYQLQLVQDPTTCPTMSHMATVGTSVTSNAYSGMAVDGADGASVACAVAASASNASSFALWTEIGVGTNSLALDATGLTSGSTKASPAPGTISYMSKETLGMRYEGQCEFFITPGTKEQVGPGLAWVEFTCANVLHSTDDCEINNGIIALQGCDTVAH